MLNILIVEDEELFREDLATILTSKGFNCKTASSPTKALEVIKEFTPEVVLSDIMLPGKSGLELLEDIKGVSPETTVIMMTAYGNLDSAIEAFRNGAADYILKPLVIDDLLNKLNRIIEQNSLSKRIEYFRSVLNPKTDDQQFIFASGKMKEIKEQIALIAPQNTNVLLLGESGTGKEIIARMIHKASGANNGEFIALNCAGFQENLLESELFGHVKGAFTGAVEDKVGFLELSENGTLFLDEIGEMPLNLQSKLLRVLEQREFYKVGGTKLQNLNSRIICATNKDLKVEIEKGNFREDLYYRLSVFEINIPPLRERREDIIPLTKFFINKLNRELGKNIEGVQPDVLSFFMRYDWPGNIRELRNVIERAMILCRDTLISAKEISNFAESNDDESFNVKTLREAVQSFEKAFLIKKLEENNWNREQTAKEIEVNPSTLYRKLSEYNISK